MLYRTKTIISFCLGLFMIISAFLGGGTAYAQGSSAVDRLRNGASGLAQGVGLQINSTPADGKSVLPTLIGTIIGNILSILGIIFFVLTLYAGLLWMFSRGDESKATQAADIIKGAIAGLIVVLASYALTNLVFDAVGVRSTTSTPAVPTDAPAANIAP